MFLGSIRRDLVVSQELSACSPDISTRLSEDIVDHFAVTDTDRTIEGVADFGVGFISQQVKHGS